MDLPEVSIISSEISIAARNPASSMDAFHPPLPGKIPPQDQFIFSDFSTSPIVPISSCPVLYSLTKALIARRVLASARILA